MKNLIITLTILLIFSVSSMGQYTQVKDHTLHVKGIAILKQVPGLIYASISIKSWSRDYSDCQNKLISKMEKIKSSLVKQDIIKDLIKMDGITVNEKREYIDGRMIHNGFNGSISLIFESPYYPDISKKLLNVLKSDSSTLNYDIGFRLSEEQKSNLRQKAIIMAIDDAKEKAQLIAKSSNIKLIRLNSITYLDDEMPWFHDRDIIKENTELPYREVVLGCAETDFIDYNPKEIGLIKTVDIEWEIE